MGTGQLKIHIKFHLIYILRGMKGRGLNLGNMPGGKSIKSISLALLPDYLQWSSR
jgi:hypothetical protein